MIPAKISGIVITKNEEANIDRCLHSLKQVADEIIVVDSFSTDNTKLICESHKVQFSVHPFEGHIQQKNIAMNLANHEYVFSLDADECLSEELIKNILDHKKDLKHDAYVLNRRTQFCGYWVKYCGWYPDTKIRLWNKNLGKWDGYNPHDYVQMKSDVTMGKLTGDLLHYSYPNMEAFVSQIDKFTTIMAQDLHGKGKKASLINLILNPGFKFFKKYFLQLGFLDGINGWTICRYSAYYTFLKYKKLKDLNSKVQENTPS